MELIEILNKFDKSKIKAGDGRKDGIYPLYTCSPKVNKFLDNYLYDTEAIILSTGGNPVINYHKGKFSYSSDCLVVESNGKFENKYIYYYLISKTNEIAKMFRGAGLKHLNKKEFFKMNIKLINLEDQKKIIKELDLINKLMNYKRKQEELLDDLIKSQFVEMFENKNYPKIKGKNLFIFSSGKFLESHKRLKEGIPVYGGNGIVWYTDKELIDYNTIVIGRVGAYCGNVKLVREPAWITDNAIYIKQFKKDVYDIDFLFNMMEAINFFKFAQKSGQPKITQKPLEEYNYIVPPIDEQINFSNIVKQIDKQKFESMIQLKMMEKIYNIINDRRRYV